MNTKVCRLMSAFAVFTAFAAGAASVAAQTAEVKEKPALYTYESDWQIPRANWPDMDKENAANQKILDQAMASGTIVANGNDQNLVHTAEGSTHDGWWSAYSMAGLMSVLDSFYKSGSTSSSKVLQSSTKHWDAVYISRFYNWRSGSWKGAYTHAAVYSLKPGAPDNAVETLSKSIFVPFLEKLLADGSIQQYQIDQQAIHTEAPNQFFISYITSSAEGLDKVNAALREAVRGNSMISATFESMVDFTPHRDYLGRTTATYK